MESAQIDLVSQEWAFSEREISISNTIIGKGAFGEVRVAKWRNIDVAAKRLHALVAELDGGDEAQQFENATTVDSFRSEMDTLSKLRHPNLVLFLGIGYNHRTRQPTTILTELLPESLYDILETHKIRLTLPEVIDIALDVATGLDYLHSHNPQVVHRDISSKNILIGGNKAKIADLGQAKLFGASALSRQTSMPGAMAYSAPEVLTGKYTSKIDIYSLGILLIQMCCGEYPRIDRREQQQALANSKYPPLSPIITQTINYQPNERPMAAAVCELLKEIKLNDRFYPPLRRQPPQCDIGVMARRYLDSTIEERAGDIRLALEQTSRRLSIEEQRWRDEAGKVDGLEKNVKDVMQEANRLNELTQRQVIEINELKDSVVDANETIDAKEQEIQSLLQEKDGLQENLRESKNRVERLEGNLAEMEQAMVESKHDLDGVVAEREKAKEEELASKSVEHNTKFQLDMQLDQCRELEMRLEQTLVRWKQEKEMVILETERCSRLRATCSALVEKELRNKEEVDRLTRRLNMYDTLPLPDEIKARFKDMEEDICRLNEENEQLKSVKFDNEKLIDDMSDKYKDTLSSLHTANEEVDSLKEEIYKKDEDISGLNELIANLTKQLDSKTSLTEKLEDDKKNLIVVAETIRDELGEVKAEADAARVAAARIEKSMTLKLKQAERRAKKKGESFASGEKEEDRQYADGHTAVDGQDPDDGDNYSDFDDDEDGDVFASTPAIPAVLPAVDLHAPMDETYSDEIRAHILHDKEKLRRYSIATRLKKVIGSELGNAESGSFKNRTVDRFHKFTGSNFGDVVHAASETKQNLHKLREVQNEGALLDETESLREMDSAAKVRVQQALEHGGVKHVMNCMWENLDSESITWRGARAIRDQFMNSDEIRQLCVDNKGEEILIAGLTAFPQSNTVQSHCLRALAALVFGNDVIRRHCGEKGCMRRVAIAMQNHSADGSVVIHACTALTNLAHNNADNRARYLEANGVQVLLTAMEAHFASSPKIQRQACWALLTLAGSDDASRSIVAAGGAEKIKKAMIIHKYDKGVQQFGCWAISNLALAGDDIRLLIRGTGIVEVCNIALETHPEDMEVVRQARHAIGVLGPVGRSTTTSPSGRGITGRKKSTLKPIRKESVIRK